MSNKTGGTFAYINIFKRYSATASDYEKENIPSNTLIWRVGNTLKPLFLKKESLKKYLEMSFDCIYILLLFTHECIDKKEKNSV